MFKPQLRRALMTATTVAAVGISLFVGASTAEASSENGCNGLYEVARFATFKNVGDTHGHETVHHQFELHGCGHHDHP